jgi:Holliday junction resolvase RusA-like endonuclease
VTAQPAGAESATFTLTLPLADLHNSNDRSHWAVVARKRKALRALAKREASRELPVFFGPVALDVTFQFPTKHRRDLDNVDLKPLIDGIVDANVLEDDSSDILVAVTKRSSPKVSPKSCVTLTFTLTSQYVPFATEE